jgi:hypothetical protein
MKSITRIFIILVLLKANNVMGQNRSQTDRNPAVAGSFYPSNANELKNALSALFEKSKGREPMQSVAALIVPHAGYVFSGEVAAGGFACLPENAGFDNIFIIGTSHHVYLDGASVYQSGDFITPLGTIKVNTEIAQKLISESKYFQGDTEAHRKEHSLEVQLPFLQYRLKKPFKIVPVIIGTQSAKVCEKIANELKPWFNQNNLFVISSDFSHYPEYNSAVETDKATGESIKTNSVEMFLNSMNNSRKKGVPGLATPCCSWTSIAVLLSLTENDPNIRIHHLKYMNSGDTRYGDRNRVVGYHSFAFVRDKMNPEFSLSEDEKRILLKIARQSIANRLLLNKSPEFRQEEITEKLQNHYGVFVTLYKNEKLRGCIGRFTANEPLYKLTGDMAVASAFNDTRFEPVEQDELKKIEIEISVLTPLRKIMDISDFKLGKHGIYIKKGTRSGTFLPKVATDTGWSTEEFLGHCARDKAGIGWDGWKDAELFVYESYVFAEKENSQRK